MDWKFAVCKTQIEVNRRQVGGLIPTGEDEICNIFISSFDIESKRGVKFRHLTRNVFIIWRKMGNESVLHQVPRIPLSNLLCADILDSSITYSRDGYEMFKYFTMVYS